MLYEFGSYLLTPCELNVGPYMKGWRLLERIALLIIMIEVLTSPCKETLQYCKKKNNFCNVRNEMWTRK